MGPGVGRKARDDEAEVPSSEPAKEVAAAANVKARVAQVAEDSLGGRCVTGRVRAVRVATC